MGVSHRNELHESGRWGRVAVSLLAGEAAAPPPRARPRGRIKLLKLMSHNDCG